MLHQHFSLDVVLIHQGNCTSNQSSPQQNVWHRVRNAVKAWSPFAVQFKKKYYPWVQLAGHESEFILQLSEGKKSLFVR